MACDTCSAYPGDRVEKNKRFWKATAEGYDAWIANDFQDQYVVNRNTLAKYMDPARRVLDVGCGPGDLTIRLAPRCREVWGVDVTPEMIRVAEDKVASQPGNVCFREADACDLPFESQTFDTVMSVNALQTMEQPELALREMHRVLRPGGELLLITYCYGDSSSSENSSLLRWAIEHEGQVLWHSFRFRQLVETLPAKGFEVVEAERIWEGPVVAFLRGRAAGC